MNFFSKPNLTICRKSPTEMVKTSLQSSQRFFEKTHSGEPQTQIYLHKTKTRNRLFRKRETRQKEKHSEKHIVSSD